jgi:hypothetical protein
MAGTRSGQAPPPEGRHHRRADTFHATDKETVQQIDHCRKCPEA